MIDVLARYDVGATLMQIAAELGVSRSAAQRAVRRALVAAGRPTRRTHHWTREDVARLVAWRQAGVSYAEIAERIGVSKSAVIARWHEWREPCREMP